MIDPRPLASYLSLEFCLDYMDVFDAVCDFFFLNSDHNGFFKDDQIDVSTLISLRKDIKKDSIDDYFI